MGPPRSVARGIPRSGDRARRGCPRPRFMGLRIPLRGRPFRVVTPCPAPQKLHTPLRPITGFRLNQALTVLHSFALQNRIRLAHCAFDHSVLAVCAARTTYFRGALARVLLNPYQHHAVREIGFTDFPYPSGKDCGQSAHAESTVVYLFRLALSWPPCTVKSRRWRYSCFMIWFSALSCPPMGAMGECAL